MKVIIAGGRAFDDYATLVAGILESGFTVTEVVSGKAKGADRMGEIWADYKKIPCKLFPADWALGKQAGPIRNQQMVDYADALIAFWDGNSIGTADVIQRAKSKGIPVFVQRYKP